MKTPSPPCRYCGGVTAYQLRDGNIPCNAMQKLRTRNGFINGVGWLMPVTPTLTSPVFVMLTPPKLTGAVNALDHIAACAGPLLGDAPKILLVALGAGLVPGLVDTCTFGVRFKFSVAA